MELAKIRNRSDAVLNGVTVALLAVVTSLAFVVKDLRAILSLSGATWGCAVIYLFPTIMFCSLAKTRSELQKEVPLAVATGITGLIMGIIGTARAIQALLASS